MIFKNYPSVSKNGSLACNEVTLPQEIVTIIDKLLPPPTCCHECKSHLNFINIFQKSLQNEEFNWRLVDKNKFMFKFKRLRIEIVHECLHMI